jgi:hypothetical protein
VIGLLRNAESWPAHGGWRHGWQWLVVRLWFSRPTLPRLSFGKDLVTGDRSRRKLGVACGNVGFADVAFQCADFL